MAENITEADSLIIQLLAALNSTFTNYTTSQSTDTNPIIANRLSLTALVVSLIALIVALLQAVLDYVNSNSAQGDKCNTGAIGEYARVSGTRIWSWRHWRRRYFYPELDLSFAVVCLSLKYPEDGTVGEIFRGLDGLRQAGPPRFEDLGCFTWRENRFPNPYIVAPMFKKDAIIGIRSGKHILCRRVPDGWEVVKPQDLPKKFKYRWLWYRIRHGDFFPGNTPRATWAQLLWALNVQPSIITRRPVSRLVSADCIPTTLDVPTQKVSLTALGIFAFCLGFQHVNIDTRLRTLSATGEIGTITTESLPGFGAVVRFQILSPHPEHFVTVRGREQLAQQWDQLLGTLILPRIGIEALLPTKFELRYDWLQKMLRDGDRTFDERIVPKNQSLTIADEAEKWCNTSKSEGTFSTHLHDWRECVDDTRTRWPSVLLAASFAGLPANTSGFPSLNLIDPFLDVFQEMTRCFSFQQREIANDFELLEDGTMVLELLHDDLDRTTGHDDLTAFGNCDPSTWLFSSLRPADVGQIEKILLSQVRHVVGGYQKGSSRGGYVARVGTPKMIGSDILALGLLNCSISPNTRELLTNFDPVSWAASMRSKSIPKPYREQASSQKAQWRNHVQPKNVLWTQTFLLDIAIRKAILSFSVTSSMTSSLTTSRSSTSSDYNWENTSLDGRFEKAATALVDCWEDPNAETPLQNLGEFLCKEFFQESTEEQREETKNLADMIKLRTLFFIAYLMVIPDSTSVYEASMKDDVVLPMI